MRSNLPGQLDLPDTAERIGDLLKQKAAAAMRPATPQQPLDVGLFSDDSLQTDLVEMLTYSHEEE